MKRPWTLIICLPLFSACSNLKVVDFNYAKNIIDTITDKYQTADVVELDIELTLKNKDNNDVMEQYAFDSKNSRLYHYEKSPDNIHQQWQYFEDNILWTLDSKEKSGKVDKVRYKNPEQPELKNLDYFRSIFYPYITSDIAVVKQALDMSGKTKEIYQSDGRDFLTIDIECNNYVFTGEFNHQKIYKIIEGQTIHIYDYAVFATEVNPNDFPEAE